MSNDLENRLAKLSPAQRALFEKRSRAVNENADARRAPGDAAEPVAVVGLGCRLPGGATLDEYWRTISEGADAIRETPADRWDVDALHDPDGGAPGKVATRWGGFLDGVDQFDPAFFGVTPREANRMDPQQRLLLEVVWEALENAGKPPAALAGGDAGVFVGIGGNDYAKVPLHQTDDFLATIDGYMGTGNALSIAANRVSYLFDLKGPSLAVDTACSSALVAVCLAVEALRRGECGTAIAGGVNAILTPETTIAFSSARMLSPSGRCRPFDAAADGYVRSEGCGVVVLRRLSDAVRDGDEVFAVLRAAAMNQDGRTSGISAPNGESQKACLRLALAQAGLTPSDLTYLEAHGTGTPLGDPIEMHALADLFGRTDPDQAPLRVASVKANIGHTETVAGVAGLIKVVLMMRHGVIPPHRGFESLNPHIDLAGSRVEIPTQSVAWEGRRIAGVSSFGFGGTNSHLIVESAPPGGRPKPKDADAAPWRPLVVKLSAKSPEALKQQAGRLSEWIDKRPRSDLAAVAQNANAGRSDFPHRAAILAKDLNELRTGVTGLANGAPSPTTRLGVTGAATRRKTAMLFSGQGAQHARMSRGLYESSDVFRRAINRCEALLLGQRERRLTSVLYGDHSEELIDQTLYTQPALFAVGYALASLWESCGVTPDCVAGHSVGEYTAAVVAGVLSLEDAVALVAERSRLMQQAPTGGAMAAVFAGEATVAEALAEAGGGVSIAAVNGPENTVVSGAADAVESLLETLTRRGTEHRRLTVSHAFHSPMMDPILDEFERFASAIPCNAPKLPLASNTTGGLMTGAPTGRYWRDHLRGAVRFADNLRALAGAGATTLLEAGPGAALLGMAKRTLEPEGPADRSAAPPLRFLPSLRKGADDRAVFAGSVAEHYASGGRIDWRGLDPFRRERLLLPTYPFERTRCWIEGADGPQRGAARGVAPSTGGVLGGRAPTAWSHAVFEARFAPASPSCLADHRVQGSVVVPASVYLEQVLQAGAALSEGGARAVGGLRIGHAMMIPDDGARRVQVTVAPESNGASEVVVSSQPFDEPDAAWTEHASARLLHGADDASAAGHGATTIGASRVDGGETTPSEDYYRRMSQRGFDYGPAFQVIESVVSRRGAALAELRSTPATARRAGKDWLPPVWGDAFLQTFAGAVSATDDGADDRGARYLPVAIESIRLLADLPSDLAGLRCYAEVTSSDTESGAEQLTGDAWLLDARGDALAEMRGIRVQSVGKESKAEQTVDDWLHRVGWEPAPLPDGGAEGRAADGLWLLIADGGGVIDRLAERLEAAGGRCLLARPGGEFSMTIDDDTRRTELRIDPGDESHQARLAELLTTNPSTGVAGIVDGSSLDLPEIDPHRSTEWPNGCGERLVGAMRLVQQLARRQVAPSAGLWFVTRGAQSATDSDRVSVGQAPLLGLARVAQAEHQELRIRLFDLDGRAAHQEPDVEQLLASLLHNDDETEVAVRGGERLAARLQPLGSPAAGAGRLTIPTGGPYQLRIPRPGTLEALRYEPVERRAPGPGEVEIEVHAAGLNFSDVLKALGLYPGVTDAVVPLGIEASGVVTAVGEGVDRFGVGDLVFGVAPYAFGSHTTTPEYTLVAKPPSLSHEQAATVPITFLTAHHALVRLAGLARGERVLIHAGAGGVGLAAIQIAKRLGAEVFATAGSDSKRDYLRRLGVEHVMSSRTLGFAEEVLAATNREGVDVVLNSLPGEAIPASLKLLRAYGRFCEIGKVDIYQDRRLGLLPFQDNLSYFAIDLDRVLRQRPDYVRTLFTDVMRRFESNEYRPLEFRPFAAEQTTEAFRYMLQRKNIGKVVVSRPTATADSTPAGGVRKDGAYLISGGLGALGRAVARDLAERGAGALVLVSRGEPGGEAATLIEELRAAGTRVATLRADVADRASVAAAFERLGSLGLPPLRGVVHAAGVLADGLLAQMSPEQLLEAYRPKADGAWNLHAATRDSPLDFFVMFSSVASVLGSPGQANYAAGNAALDALARARRSAGLPASAINWGPWADAGMAAEPGRGAGLEDRGMRLLPPADALALMTRLVGSATTQAIVADADWPALRTLAGDRAPSLLRSIDPRDERASGAAGLDASLRRRLIASDARARHDALLDLLREDLARVMSVAPEGVDTTRPLAEFGVDSLMSLELKNGLERRLGVTLPMAKLLDGPSIDSLATEVGRLLVDDAPPTAGGASPPGAVWTPLTTVRPGPAAPLFLLPTLGGDARCYREVAAALTGGAEVLAFRPRGLADDGAPHDAMEELAGDYAGVITDRQPAGPCRLAAWSTGGVPALAVAERLEASGREVSLVALFDTPPPEVYHKLRLDDDAQLLYETLQFASRFSGLRFGMSIDALRALPDDERFPAAVAEARGAGLFPGGADNEEHLEAYLRHAVAVGVGLVHAARDYEPRRLAAPVALFRPRIADALPQFESSGAAAAAAWENHPGLSVTTHAVDGDHFSMMTGKGAEQIAARLSRLLAGERAAGDHDQRG